MKWYVRWYAIVVDVMMIWEMRWHMMVNEMDVWDEIDDVWCVRWWDEIDDVMMIWDRWYDVGWLMRGEMMVDEMVDEMRWVIWDMIWEMWDGWYDVNRKENNKKDKNLYIQP